MHQGKIVKGIAGFYYVDVPDDGIYECKARGIFRKNNIKPLIGDMVNIEIQDKDKKKGNVVKILPRKNELIRPTVANIDQAIIVFAVTNPDPNYSLLDRFLILAEEQSIDIIICFNKVDLPNIEEVKNKALLYEQAGYEVIITSVKEEVGTQALLDKLKNVTTVFAGPSGVGKSSLLNMIHPKLDLETGNLSEKIKRGKHTTRHAELLPIQNGGYVVDTPGFSSLYLHHIALDELKLYFREFAQYSGTCRFNGCSHIHEPDCMVKDAVESGNISKMRYESYKFLYDEIKDYEEKMKRKR